MVHACKICASSVRLKPHHRFSFNLKTLTSLLHKGKEPVFIFPKYPMLTQVGDQRLDFRLVAAGSQKKGLTSCRTAFGTPSASSNR